MLGLLKDKLATGRAWELALPDGSVFPVGEGTPQFRLQAATAAGISALRSLDELRIAEAYCGGDLNVDGDFLPALSLRAALIDSHPLFRFWSTRVQPMLRGQVASDKAWIHRHYDEDAAFFEAFLDKKYRCYSHALFSDSSEPLEAGIERKLSTAVKWTEAQSGTRVLDVGGGWGAFVQFAGSRGIEVTSLTISQVSEKYVNDLIGQNSWPCRVIREHLLEYRCAEPFDAIVNLGVTEHLPDYPATLRAYERLLKPGGRVYLDASAARSLPSTVTASLIYPGNGKFVDIAEYMQAVQKSHFDLLHLNNDSKSYQRTMYLWAKNLEDAREWLIQRFGMRQYRRFHLYLWGGTHAFSTGELEAYRWVLRRRA